MDWFPYDNGLCHERVQYSLELWSRVFLEAFCPFQKQPPKSVPGKGAVNLVEMVKICGKFTGEHPCRSVISIKSENMQQIYRRTPTS